jgi:beta-lactamase superfamily II metal-dependent hydrolase
MSSEKGKSPMIRIAFLDVGQGDTSVITCPETQEAIVVDCIDEQAVIDYLRREQIRHLRGVIVTHIHADHYKGVAGLLRNCAHALGIEGCEVLASSDDIIDLRSFSAKAAATKWPPDNDKHSTMYDEPRLIRRQSSLANLYHWTKTHRDQCEPLRDTRRLALPFDGTLVQSLSLIHPPHVDYSRLRMSGLNNISVVLHVKGSGSSALLMGDLEYAGWRTLKVNHPDIACDVLKFPHHGGTWQEDETDDLLSVLAPSVVVLSVGSDNTYGHPSPGVFASLQRRNDVYLLCTQATNSCLVEGSVQNEVPAITEKIRSQVCKEGAFFVIPRPKQCPCAGTVIVELADQLRIVQPDRGFHKNEIIHAHFKGHKCLAPI